MSSLLYMYASIYSQFSVHFLSSFISITTIFHRFLVFYSFPLSSGIPITEVQSRSLVLQFTSICAFYQLSGQLQENDNHRVVHKCLGLTSCLWDHDLRKRPFSNPKNTGFQFSHELWSLLFDVVTCFISLSSFSITLCPPSPSLGFLSFSLKPPSARSSCIISLPSNKPDQSPSDSLVYPIAASREGFHLLYVL